MQAWRAAQSFGLLRKAWEGWVRDGLTDAPLAKISELAAGEHASPARVDTLVQDIAHKVASAAAGGGNQAPNPIGILIAGLAMQRDVSRRGRPREVLFFVASKWQHLEEQAMRVMRVQVAREAASQAAICEAAAQRMASIEKRRDAAGRGA